MPPPPGPGNAEDSAARAASSDDNKKPWSKPTIQRMMDAALETTNGHFPTTHNFEGGVYRTVTS